MILTNTKGFPITCSCSLWSFTLERREPLVAPYIVEDVFKVLCKELSNVSWPDFNPTTTCFNTLSSYDKINNHVISKSEYNKKL